VLTLGSTSAMRKGATVRACLGPAVGQPVTTDGAGTGPRSGPLTGPHGPTDPSPVMSIDLRLMLNATHLCGADPLVRAGPPGPALSSTQADEGVGR
jgi:hypothetical protein